MSQLLRSKLLDHQACLQPSLISIISLSLPIGLLKPPPPFNPDSSSLTLQLFLLLELFNQITESLLLLSLSFLDAQPTNRTVSKKSVWTLLQELLLMLALV